MYCVVAIAGKGWGQRRNSHRKAENAFCFVYETSIKAVHSSCIFCCCYGGILMPNPVAFFWTILPMTLVSIMQTR